MPIKLLFLSSISFAFVLYYSGNSFKVFGVVFISTIYDFLTKFPLSDAGISSSSNDKLTFLVKFVVASDDSYFLQKLW